MRKLSFKKLLITILCCILLWVCFIICMETKNIQVFAVIVSASIMIVLMYLLFDKLNKIIKLLQKIADGNNETNNESTRKV